MGQLILPAIRNSDDWMDFKIQINLLTARFGVTNYFSEGISEHDTQPPRAAMHADLCILLHAKVDRTLHHLVNEAIRSTKAREAYKALENHFEPTRQTALQSVLMKMDDIRPDGDVNSAVAAFQKLFDELTQAVAQLEKGGRPMTAQDLVKILTATKFVKWLTHYHEFVAETIIARNLTTFQEVKDAALLQINAKADLEMSASGALAFRVAPSSQQGKAEDRNRPPRQQGPGRGRGQGRGHRGGRGGRGGRGDRGGRASSQEPAWTDLQHALGTRRVISAAALHQTPPEFSQDPDVEYVLADSGSGGHFQTSEAGLENFDPEDKCEVALADGQTVKTDGAGYHPQFGKIHVVRTFKDSLMSTAKLCDLHLQMLFTKSGVELFKDGKRLVTGPRVGDSYYIPVRVRRSTSMVSAGSLTASSAVTASSPATASAPATTAASDPACCNGPCKLHLRTHWSATVATQAITGKLVTGAPPTDLASLRAPCVACILGKTKLRKHRASKHRSKEPFELIHIDTKEMSIVGIGGYKYILVIVDDFSRGIFAYAMRRKSEIVAKLERFLSQVVHFLGYSTRRIRADRGEAFSQEMDELCTKHSMRIYFTTAGDSRANGVAERAIQTLDNAQQALRRAGNFPENCWPEIVPAATHIQHRSPHQANPNKQSPFQMLSGKPADISHLRAFGCRAYLYTGGKATKDRVAVGQLIGYGQADKTYRIRLKNGAIRESDSVQFNEDVFHADPISLGSGTSQPTASSPPQPMEADAWTTAPAAPRTSAPARPPSTFTPRRVNQPANRFERLRFDEDSDEDSDFDDDAQNGDLPDRGRIGGVQHGHRSFTAPSPTQRAPNSQPTAAAPPSGVTTRSGREVKPVQKTQAFHHGTSHAQTNEWEQTRKSQPEPQPAPQPATQQQSANTSANVIQVRRAVAMHADRVIKKLETIPPDETKVSHKEAMQTVAFQKSSAAEIQHLKDIGAIKIVDRPEGVKEHLTMWVHRRKFDAAGNFLKAKSRLTIRGDLMVPGEDFDPDNTASPTAHLTTIMLFLAVVNQLDLETAQYDVTSAYPLAPRKGNKPLYMKFPAGMEPIEGKTIEVGNLYGHPEAAANWNAFLDEILRDFGLKRTVSDAALYVLWYDERNFLLVCTYVDDFRAGATTQEILLKFEVFIMGRLPVTRQDDTSFLGMRIVRDRVAGTTTILQTGYIEDLLKKYGMEQCKPCDTPAATGQKLSHEDTTFATAQDEAFPFAEAVGALLWVARCSHPEIHYAVNRLGSHVQCPSSTKVKALKRVLRYLQGAKELGVVFRRTDSDNWRIKLRAFSDADYAESTEDGPAPLRSTTGFAVFVQGVGLVASKTELQPTVALSTSEAEYMALGETAKTVIHLRELLDEMQFPQGGEPTIISEDNQAAIAMAKNRLSSARTKHIKVRHHFLRELIANHEIDLVYCSTDDQVADIFTKPLPREKFVRLRTLLLNG
jgi:hypothetical protein